MSERPDKFQEMINEGPALFEKLNKEVKRILEEKEAKDMEDLLIKTVKNVSDIELTSEDYKELSDEPKELDLEEPENVSGGWSLKNA